MYEELEKRNSKDVTSAMQKGNSGCKEENSHWKAENSNYGLKPVHLIQFRKKKNNIMESKEKTGTNKFHERFQSPLTFINGIVQRCEKIVKSGIDKAKEVAKKVLSNSQFDPPAGYRGGERFYNREGILNNYSAKLKSFQRFYEYDINPYVSGVDRGGERIVIGDDLTVWYTKDHYKTFEKIEVEHNDNRSES